VKPARGERDEVVLVPLLKSASSFQVEIVYATTLPSLAFAGSLEGVLSLPDIVETRSTWDVFLPGKLSWGGVDTNMAVLEKGNGVVEMADAMERSLKKAALNQDGHSRSSTGLLAGAEPAAGGAAGTGGVLPLRIHVPRQGVHYRFEKLFANRGEERARFTIRYSSAGARTSGGLLMVLSVLILASLLAGRLGMVPRLSNGPAVALGFGAICCLVVSVTFLGANFTWAVASIILAGVLIAGKAVISKVLSERS
jgi:hypothetical protein